MKILPQLRGNWCLLERLYKRYEQIWKRMIALHLLPAGNNVYLFIMLRVANAAWNWCLMLCWEQLVLLLLLDACLLCRWLMNGMWYSSSIHLQHTTLYITIIIIIIITLLSGVGCDDRLDSDVWCYYLYLTILWGLEEGSYSLSFPLPTASGMALSMPVTGNRNSDNTTGYGYGDRVLYCCLLYLR